MTINCRGKEIKVTGFNRDRWGFWWVEWLDNWNNPRELPAHDVVIITY